MATLGRAVQPVILKIWGLIGDLQMITFIKKIDIIFALALILTVALIPSAALCGDGSKEKTVNELTKTFQADGWYNLTFTCSGQDTVSIHHAGVTQKDRLTEGQLVSGLGPILTPKVVAELTKSGFKKGVLIDGKSREYPFEISTKYNIEYTAFMKKLSGGK
jgi:hypothetical protein